MSQQPHPTDDHFQLIYQKQAAAYRRMVAAEDADGNLRTALEHAVPPGGQIMLDLGTGTGRVATLLSPLGKVVIGLDLQQAMLMENQRTQANDQPRSQLIQADIHWLPIRGQSSDLTAAGWSIGHLCGWHPTDWQYHIARVISEMIRVTKSGGTLLIFETMGTGTILPKPPTTPLADYYRLLVGHWGFQQQVIASDYQFDSASEAAEATEFFFGSELADKIRENDWARVPEWTGIWTRRLD